MILVTGGTGFVGSHLLRHLIGKKEKIRVLFRDKTKLRQFGGHIGVEPFYADLTDSSSLIGITKNVDVVFHLAAVINAKEELRDFYWSINVQGTYNLLKAFQKEREQLKRFVFCSSVGVMGHLRSIPANEDTICAPNNLYEKSKYEAEGLVKEFCDKEGLPASIIRPSWVYGPGDKRTLKLFRAISNKRFINIGDGKTLIHPVYVEDIVQGLMLCASKDEALGQTYIIAGEKAISLEKLMNVIAENCNTHIPRIGIPLWFAKIIAILCEIVYKPFSMKPPISRRRLEFFLKDQYFDISKAQNEIGFKPVYKLAQGIKQTVKWYRDNKYL